MEEYEITEYTFIGEPIIVRKGVVSVQENERNVSTDRKTSTFIRKAKLFIRKLFK